MINNLAKLVINNGGTITPLILPEKEGRGMGLCNVSIFLDDNGELLLDWPRPKKITENVNLDYNIRDFKVCTYPEDDIKWTEGEIFKTYEHADRIWDIKDQYEDKVPLLEFKIQDSSVVYILNTESVPHVDADDIQVIVCPCSGLHQFK